MGGGPRVFDRKRLSFAAASLGLLLIPAPWIEPAKLTAMTSLIPFAEAARLAREALTRYELPPEVRKEIDFLSARVAELESENRKLLTAFESVQALRTMTLSKRFSFLPADVVLPRDASPWRESLVVRAGSRQNVRPGLPVLWNRHLVGRIAHAGPFLSRVQLTCDPAFRAGAVLSLEGAAPNAIASGFGEGRILLRWLLDPPPIPPGTPVETMPDPEAAVPAGLRLGTVIGMDRVGGGYCHVLVEPEIRFASLATVTILIPREE